MTRFSLAAPLALAFLAGCATQTTNAALAAAEAVAADLVSLEQQVQASGATLTPAELTALANAVSAAQAGVTALSDNSAQASTVLATITAALQQVEPFLPEIAAVIATLGTPASATALAPAADNLLALAQLRVDFAKLRAAA